jgi:hypothetical protein
MGSPAPQSDLTAPLSPSDPAYQYLQQLSIFQQPQRNQDILNIMARILGTQPQPQPSSSLPHPQPTPGVAYDPYARTTDSPQNIQSRMGEVQPAMIQPGDIAGMMAGSALTGPGRAVLGSERGAVGAPIREAGGRTSLVLKDGTALVGGRNHGEAYTEALRRGLATEDELSNATAAFTRPDGTSWNLQGKAVPAKHVVNLGEGE